jgi:hypothetical protein
MGEKPDWEVDEAVDEVIRAIDRGAPGIDLGDDARRRLRTYYTETFGKMHSEKANWRKDKLVVLPLAHLVGSIAALREAGKTLPRGLPSEISEQSAVEAASMVSFSRHCDGPKFLGGYCDPPVGGPLSRAAVLRLALGTWADIFGEGFLTWADDGGDEPVPVRPNRPAKRKGGKASAPAAASGARKPRPAR